jgi:hypothetical protein
MRVHRRRFVLPSTLISIPYLPYMHEAERQEALLQVYTTSNDASTHDEQARRLPVMRKVTQLQLLTQVQMLTMTE